MNFGLLDHCVEDAKLERCFRKSTRLDRRWKSKAVPKDFRPMASAMVADV